MNEQILPVDGYEHYETEYIDDLGFRVHAKRPKPGYVPEPEPAPADPENWKAEKFALEAASGGKNTLLFDDLGKESLNISLKKPAIFSLSPCICASTSPLPRFFT